MTPVVSGYIVQPPVTLQSVSKLSLPFQETVGVKYYAKAMNVMRTLAATYDEALGKYDVIILPTIPFKPLKLPEPDCNVDGKWIVD